MNAVTTELYTPFNLNDSLYLHSKATVTAEFAVIGDWPQHQKTHAVCRARKSSHWGQYVDVHYSIHRVLSLSG